MSLPGDSSPLGPTRVGGALVLALALVAPVLGCSVRRLAVRAVGNALASGGDVFGTDDDPELVREAVPFGLKMTESLLEQAPRHEGLLLSACRGFTQYSVAFVQTDAELAEPSNPDVAAALRARALLLDLRAREYGLRALELHHAGVRDALARDPRSAIAGARRAEVPVLYWTAAAWGSAISLGKDRPELFADWPAVRALLERALALDESWDRGSLHEAMIPIESLPASMGGSPERAREHYRRAVALSGGLRASPHVTLATTLAVSQQDQRGFEDLLARALAVDPERDPPSRLANLIAQRRARGLLARKGDLFLEDSP